MTPGDRSRDRWWVGLALRWVPDELREEHAEEIEDAVEEALEGLSGFRRILVGTRILVDLVWSGLRLRFRPERPSPPRRRVGSTLAASLPLDSRAALRGLLRTRTATLAILGTLVVGVGLTTAIHSVLERAFVRPLPYAAPHELVEVRASLAERDIERARLGGGDWRFLRRESKAFVDMAAVWEIRQNLTGASRPEQIRVGWVSANLFELLGVGAPTGRIPLDDDPPGTVVLSRSLAERQFGGPEAALGKHLRLDGQPCLVIGVLPAGFRLHLDRYPEQIDLWKVPDDRWQNGDVWEARGGSGAMLRVVGRLASEAPLAAAAEELEALAARIREDVPAFADAGLELRPVPLSEGLIEDARPLLRLLGAAVVLVLLIATVNIVHLQAARARRRHTEVFVRRALGAHRAGLARILLLEGCLLAAVGGLGALATGHLGILWLQRVAAGRLPRIEEVELDPRIVALGLGTTLVVTLFSSLLPLFGRWRGDLSGMLRARSSTAGRRGRSREALLVVGQVAASLVLLHAAGLLLTSLARLADQDPGFRPDRHLTFAVSLPGTSYEWPVETDRFFRELEDRLEALPTVRSAGVVWPLPLGGSSWRSLVGAPELPESEDWAQLRLATPGAFPTLGVPLEAGRLLRDGDRREVTVVSRALAERLWPGRDAVGRMLLANPWGRDEATPFEIVGVVGDVRHMDLRGEPEPTAWFDSSGWSWADWEVDVVVEAVGDPETLVPGVREVVASLDPAVPVADARPYREVVDAHLAEHRFAVGVIGLFAGVAALLTAIGLYGVAAFSVASRTREMGIRMALGATRAAIRRLVLGEGLRLGFAGVALGLLLALGAVRLVESLLYGIVATDPGVLLRVVLGLLALAAVACWFPARRAASLEPIRVLREE